MRRRTITAAIALVLAGACTAGEGKAPASPAASPVEPAVVEGLVPCPVVWTAGGEAVQKQGPCLQRRDPQGSSSIHIYDRNGVLVAINTP